MFWGPYPSGGLTQQLTMMRTRLIGTVLGVLMGLMASAMAEESSHLVSGSIFAPGLIPPGWIADHLQVYTSDRSAYAESCRTDAVVEELQTLSKQVDHEEDLRHTARNQLLHTVVTGESAAKRQTVIALNALAPLDDDIAVLDGLIVRLSSLPDCDDATASSAPASEPPPSQTATANLVAPSLDPPPTVIPAEPASAEPAPAEPPASPPTPRDDGAAPSSDSDDVVVRFDERMRGLTPSSIRTLDAALKALGEGHKVQIAIEGCKAGDGTPESADCSERTRRLKRILRDDGVSHPSELIVKPR